MKQKQRFQIVRKLSEFYIPSSSDRSQAFQATYFINPISQQHHIFHIFLSGQDHVVSAPGVRVVPQGPGGRPPHRVHQVQEAGDHPHRVQCGAGQGAQVRCRYRDHGEDD